MIEPIQSLAFSMQSNPKVYALLLGSGVSRSAEIPTGWEIIIDLLGKLAASTGETGVSDLEGWYVQKYQEAPDYSKILDALARTPSERQQLLRPYFEPDDQQRQEGLKQPTAAHKAIARLVAQGFIKVIVTTNFDRLIEKALEDEGVVPTVLSTVDQVKGALPLDHIDCCVFKVHGDYLDPRIRNTQSELEKYPQEYDILNRIFDDYGLVVCGWSGSWDTALRNALFRAHSRRFTTYWALHGEASDEAEQLIRHRSAQVIHIDDADRFFQNVQQTVTSIEEYSRPHPLSTEAAVASLKRYLPREEYRIQLMDLIDTTVEQVVRDTTGEGFDLGTPTQDKTTITARLRRYESSCITLTSMAALGGYWGNEDSFAGWDRALERLATKRLQHGTHYFPIWSNLQTYPGVLLLYALGLGALEANQLNIVNRIFRQVATDPYAGTHSSSASVVDILLSYRDAEGQLKGKIEGMETNYLPVSDRLHDVLRQPLKPLIADDVKYTLIFDKFEILAALSYVIVEGRNSGFGGEWFPPGAYMYRRDNRERILTEIQESISSFGDYSSFVRSGIFGHTASECSQLIQRFKDYVSSSARFYLR